MKSAKTVCKYPTRGPDGLMHVCELPLPCFIHALAEPAGDPPTTAGDSTASAETPAGTAADARMEGTGFAPVDPSSSRPDVVLLRTPRQFLSAAMEDYQEASKEPWWDKNGLALRMQAAGEIRLAIRLLEMGRGLDDDRGGK